LEPTELWDNNGDGVEVKKPDYSCLGINDIALIFPKTEENSAKDIRESLEKTSCSIMTQEDMSFLLTRYMLFPEFIRIGRVK
jgi:hypothetical protein